MASEIETEIRKFIVETFLFGQDDEGLGPSDSLLGRGILDSTGVLEIVAFLEEKWGVKVNDAELVPANFDTLASLAAFVARKKG